MNLYKNINDLDYFALLMIKELKNKTMEIQIIVIDKIQVDFDMKLEIVYFKRKKLALISIEILIT